VSTSVRYLFSVESSGWQGASNTSPALITIDQGAIEMTDITIPPVSGSRNPRPLRFEGEFAYVPLTKGYEAKIDAADAHLVAHMRWSASVCGVNHIYARALYMNKTYLLHRVIMAAPAGMSVDHINHDTLDNTRANLRVCTHKENQNNRRGAQRNSTTGVRGVHIANGGRQFRATYRGQNIGCFPTVDAAAAAWRDYMRSIGFEV
jgi:hypothetical protein